MFRTHHIICALWVTIAIVAIASPAHSGPVDESEMKKLRECKNFCGSCGCIGFYCGEECICECNEENNDDTECIASIQTSAKRKKIPFEILIQGPSGNRFLRNALQFEQNPQQCSKGDFGRSKRSTIVIYKPAADISLDPNGYCEKPAEEPRQQLFRGRRAVDTESWFTDFSNTLVKPAPTPGTVIKAKETKESKESKEEEEVKVKVKKQQPKKVSTTTESDELLPRIREKIKNTLNRDGGLVKEIRKTVKKIETTHTAKKIRGAISNIRSKAEDILLPSSDEPQSNSTKSGSKTLLNKLRGRILRTFGDTNDLDERRE